MAEEELGFPEPSEVSGIPEPLEVNSGDQTRSNATSQTKESLNPGVFLQDTQKELGQVTWPSRQQLISESLAVIAMVALSATLVYFLDDLFVKMQTVVFPS